LTSFSTFGAGIFRLDEQRLVEQRLVEQRLVEQRLALCARVGGKGGNH
jgi:hypothetical protein